jgi:uncharacterized protein (TIRG00374 family)
MKRWISITVSLLILGVIYWKIDFPRLGRIFQDCNGWWMTISLGMVVPLTLLTAWRLQQLMPHGTTLHFGEANRLILAASVLNMVLPSKMGDIAKAYFLKERGHLNGSLSLSLVLFEKACDVLSLLLWCAFGLILYPAKDSLFWVMTGAVALGLAFGLLLVGSRRFARLCFVLGQRIAPSRFRGTLENLRASWDMMLDYFWQERAIFYKVVATSVFLWSLHLLQIWFFILALNAWAPFLSNLALSPLAILAGLLPLTFAGVGTRDAALIFFYKPFFSPPVAAALGLLCTSRYLLPAIGGLPFFGHYLATVRGIRSSR